MDPVQSGIVEAGVAHARIVAPRVVQFRIAPAGMTMIEGHAAASLTRAISIRLIPGLAVNLVLAFAAWRAGSIRMSGVLAGLLVGTAIWLGGDWPYFSVLAGFFIAGSALTKLGYSRKAARGLAEADKGRRGWQNAFANAGVGAIAAIAWLWSGDARLAAAFVASFATAIFDTAGSEIGGLYGKTPISLRTFRKVPAGTEGAVSLEGTLGALGAAAFLVIVGVVVRVIPPAFAVPVLGAAVLGGLYESVAAGKLPLGHTALNFTNTLVGAALAFLFASLR